MHSQDGDFNVHSSESPMSDEGRMGMWDLIQLDLFFRLINNKPAVFATKLHEWRVDLPWLSVDFPSDRQEAVPVMAFLVRSRITFVLVKYFQMLEDLQNSSQTLKQIEPLCEEVERAFDEWKVVCLLSLFRLLFVYGSILTVLRRNNGFKVTVKATLMPGYSAIWLSPAIRAFSSCFVKRHCQHTTSSRL